MGKLHNPLLPKKGGLGVLALFLILLISCSQTEIIAKPTVEQIVNEKIVQLADDKAEPTITQQKITGVVSLDDAKPKIDPELVKELKELKRHKRHKRVKVLVELENEKALEAVEQAGGTIQQNFDIGNVAVVEVQSDKVEELSNFAGIEQVSAEKEYVALLADRIPAFSIDTAVWANNITGKNVKIAILDTGVGPHNKIAVASGISFVEGESESDQNGHGTHVAGIARGVAPDAAIYNAKVLSKAGAGTTSQIIAGINWAVENNVDIISMSFGGMFTELDGPLASAVKDAINHGVVFVVAAGNCKTGCGGFYGVTTPGNVKEVITVGAVDDSNIILPFSSGDTFDGYIKPDVVGPGKDITSAWLNNGEKTISGTSMSTPFVAGIAALLLEKEPGLTNEQVKQRLETAATDAGENGKDVSYGAGIINVAQILDSATDSALLPSVEMVNYANPWKGMMFADIPKQELYNLTILTDEDNRTSYKYNTESGDIILLSFSISKKTNATNFSSQMYLPKEVRPGDFIPVSLEFDTDDAPVDPPETFIFYNRDSSGSFGSAPIGAPLPSAFIDKLYSAGPRYEVIMDITFSAPTIEGSYRAYAEIWDAIIDGPVMLDIAEEGRAFDVDSSAVLRDECDRNSECPSDRYDDGPFCKSGDVYRDWKDWYCVSPSSSYSYCNFELLPKKVEDCGTGTCMSGECVPECIDADDDGEGTAFPCPLFSDCDDTNPFIHHGAEEICGNEIDENCFGGADEGCPGKPCTTNSQCKSNVCYSGICIPPCPDSDEDGYGIEYNPVCTNPGIDCNDAVATINPGAAEWCTDSVDNNCNGLVNENCPCTKNSNCAAGMSCSFTGTSGSCQAATCENECSVAGVSTCSGTAIYTCTNSDSDACLENTYTTNCGTGTICEDGKSTCQAKPNVQLLLEETQLPLYAQAGDKITAVLTASGTQSAQLVYPANAFTLDTASCSGTFSFSGTRECVFTVKDTAPPKAHWIGVKYGPSRKVTVVTKPNVLIVTHKPMLFKRFSSATSVNKLLKQTYDYAYNKKGIVYDLADYSLPQHPFVNTPYTETYDNQNMKDNSFAIEAGAFIKEKCNGCTSTLILGDDFVVPHYRRDLDKSFFFGLSKETDEVYSDISYVGRTNLQFSEFEEIFYQKEKFNGKKVMLILPDEVTPAQRTQIDKLKDFIEDDDGPINGDIIDELEASDAPCNSHLAFTYYDGYTLVIIGTSKTNKALQCFPFVIENDLESVTIERNPWDGRAYAVVVNSDTADQIAILNDLLETGEYKNLHSSGWLVARTAGNVAAGAAVGLVILGSGGTAAPVMLAVASGLGVATDYLDGAECLEFGGGECTDFFVGLLLPIGIDKLGKNVIMPAIEIVGPRLRYFYGALGEDGFAAFFKRMGKKGMLNPGSGFDKLMKFIGDNDRVGNTVVKDLSEYLARSGGEFAAFLSKVADASPARAAGILKIAHAAKLDPSQLAKVISSDGIPANLLVKSIDNLAPSFKVFTDEALTYSNGKLRPAFRGLAIKNLPDDPIKAAEAIDSQFKLVHGQSGYDPIRQIGTGYQSDQLVVSFSHDFGIASGIYALRDSDAGVVVLYDKTLAAFADSQQMLKQLDEIIPFAKVKGPNIPVESVRIAALNNNELSLLGEPSIIYSPGWYRILKSPDGVASKHFVANPLYIGKSSDWSHINTVEKIKNLHNENDVANYQRIIDYLKSKGFDDDELPDFDLRRGNTEFWPKEVS